MQTAPLNELIWQIVASIPEGKVATYGQIATLAGYPNHARYVGTTLKKLPKDTGLPWHRVVNARGESSFPKGSDAYKRQMERLEAEGVIFRNGRLSFSRYGIEQRP
ncbi:O6-methylguanine-DNA methyltransferase [Marinobacterium zhoushanense]|uniref:O6-methylguanine-DNA methyltransferase n=1 Tax=Marinobacterium zhoushanense TaxID=1679163 RepID=A0ABQ1K0D6_9GAMM|nr:MGMT family protein [Marinobacterium zhoushanense]GGB80331.1 O6-methylguanine-DNA methyltransferase [Marinobacterium zhoushanense]